MLKQKICETHLKPCLKLYYLERDRTNMWDSHYWYRNENRQAGGAMKYRKKLKIKEENGKSI